MTPEELQAEIANIIALHGQPLRDFDGKNEAARLIDALHMKNKIAKMQAGRKKADSLKDIVADVSAMTLKQYINKKLLPIYLEDKDLKQFNELEKQILQAHYEDSTLNNEQLANRFGVKRQQVTALFNSMEAKLLKIKLFERECPDKIRLALLHLIEDNDQKTTLRLAEHYGIVKAEKQDINITSKPIDDPEAIKMLRELGDKLSDTKPQ
jgi:hypothetical protein